MNGWSMFVRQATALCLLLAVAVAVVLLTVTHQVQKLEDELGALQRHMVVERQKIHVLQAEFTYLAETERLRRLAARHLSLAPIEPQQLASFHDLDEALALRIEQASAQPPATGPAKPIRRSPTAPMHVAARDRAR